MPARDRWSAVHAFPLFSANPLFVFHHEEAAAPISIGMAFDIWARKRAHGFTRIVQPVVRCHYSAIEKNDNASAGICSGRRGLIHMWSKVSDEIEQSVRMH